jgi:hypothetical protein
MKLFLSLSLALAVSASAHAQTFRPSHISGGSDRSEARRGPVVAVRGGSGYHPGHYHGPRFGAVRYPGGHGVYGHGRAYAAPVFGYYDGYSAYDYPYYSVGTGYYSGSRGAAANGLLLGALAGGIIGHNSGDFRHNGWRGAAWGAGVGWLLGTIADANRRVETSSYPQAQVIAQPAAVAPAAAPAAAPAQPVTIINNY